MSGVDFGGKRGAVLYLDYDDESITVTVLTDHGDLAVEISARTVAELRDSLEAWQQLRKARRKAQRDAKKVSR